MSRNEHNRKIIIIGASSGIGKESAKIYLSEGHTVGLAARRVELLNCLTTGTDATIEYIDIRDIITSQTTLKHLIQKIDGVDLIRRIVKLSATVHP